MYENLKDEIRSVVRPNLKSQINGQNLQDVLIDMVDNYPTGSEDIPPILAKTGSWDNAATWVTDNSASLVTSESLYPVVEGLEEEIQEVKDTYATTASLENVSSSLNDKIEGVSSSLGDSIQDVKDTYATTASLNELSESIASTFPQYATTESLNQVSSSLNEKIDGAISGSGFATTESLNNLSSSIAQDFSKYATTASLNSLSSSVGVMSASFNQRINSITGSGGSGSTVVVNPILTSGTKIAEITVDGSRSDLYAPQGGGGSGSNSPWEYGPGSSSAQTPRNSALGVSSIAEGWETTASGSHSHAEGSRTIAIGLHSHAEGSYTTASGEDSHAEGGATTALGQASHAEGDNTKASGIYSHAEGNWTVAEGGASHTEGGSTRAKGDSAHAEGSNTLAFGDNSHAEGEKGQGYYGDGTSLTFIEGGGPYTYSCDPNVVLVAGDILVSNLRAEQIRKTRVLSHSGTTVVVDSQVPNDDYEVVQEGALGASSHVEGKGTLARNSSEHAEGEYNVSHAWPDYGAPGSGQGTLHSIGIGTAHADRKNALEVLRDGNIYVYGVGNYNGKTISGSIDLATVLNNYETWTFILEDSSSVTKSVLIH